MQPEILTIVETAVYVDDLDAAKHFYATVLGLSIIQEEPGRHVFFRVGDSHVLLAFLPDATLNGEMLPSHGAIGPGHFALGIERQAFDAWRERLTAQSVVIEKELEWPNSGRSVYFRDPAGNSVELVTPGVWGLPSGW
jgi:catechol 2,3-dioxygenase-like lactoylglutathione lyase family enzyme